MDEKTTRISEWLGGKYADPFKVDLFVTHRCNLNCIFCNYPRKQPAEELSKDVIMRIAKEAGKMGVRVMGILGGEPFVRKDVLMEFMSEIKKQGIAGSLVTNGVLISKAEIKKIIKIKWDLIRFSLDGSKPETHDSLRGCKGCFDKLVSAIRIFQKSKKEYNSNMPTIEINTVLCQKNLKDIGDIVKLCSSLGIKRIYFLPVIEFVEGIEKLKIKEDDYITALNEIEMAEKLSVIEGITTNLNDIKKDYIFTKTNKTDRLLLGKDKAKEEGYVPCFAPWYAMSIDAEGYVTPCGQIEIQQETNIKRSSLKKVWLGTYFSRLRGDMLKKRLPHGCSRCCMPSLDENKEIREALCKK